MARIYKLSPSDMDAVIELVSEIVDERTREIDILEEKLKLENPEKVDDVLDDLRPYNFWRHNFFWESCIWRLQGIFEGILDERFLDDSRKYRGLRDRIKELKLKGFVISQEEELFIWSEFRNELSHSPPKQIIGHGAQIGKEDVIRFRDFLVTILKELESKKGNNY